MASQGFADLELQNRERLAVIRERCKVVQEAAMREGVDLRWREREEPLFATVDQMPEWYHLLREAIKKWNWDANGGMKVSQDRRNQRRPRKR